MFRVSDGKIHVYGRWIPMETGSHTITINPETGAIVNDGDGTPACSYTLDPNTGHVKITSLLSKSGQSGKKPLNGLSARFERKISAGVLYEDPLGVGQDKIGYAEGFVFSFNYYSLAHVASAWKPYRWAGGRVCYSSMFTPGAQAGQGKYTAIPSSMSCGMAGWDYYSDFAPVYGVAMGGFGFLNAAQRDAIEFYGNSTSITFAYRTHRKYLFFASNVYGLFEGSLGPIAGGASGFPPKGGTIPDPSSTSFKYSMFSLRQ